METPQFLQTEARADEIVNPFIHWTMKSPSNCSKGTLQMGFSWYRLNVSETRFTDSPIARPKPEFSLSSSRGVVRGIAEAEKGKGDAAVPTARLATLYANPRIFPQADADW